MQYPYNVGSPVVKTCQKIMYRTGVDGCGGVEGGGGEGGGGRSTVSFLVLDFKSGAAVETEGKEFTRQLG